MSWKKNNIFWAVVLLILVAGCLVWIFIATRPGEQFTSISLTILSIGSSILIGIVNSSESKEIYYSNRAKEDRDLLVERHTDELNKLELSFSPANGGALSCKGIDAIRLCNQVIAHRILSSTTGVGIVASSELEMAYSITSSPSCFTKYEYSTNMLENDSDLQKHKETIKSHFKETHIKTLKGIENFIGLSKQAIHAIDHCSKTENSITGRTEFYDRKKILITTDINLLMSMYDIYV